MYKNILVAVDSDEPRSWSQALPVALAMARCFSARVTLCSVVRNADAERLEPWSAIGYRQMLDLARVRLQALAAETRDVPMSVEVGAGTICRGILDVVARIGADLIVLSSHRPRIGDYLLAANASRVARRADCSVLVVRESGSAQQAQAEPAEPAVP